MVKTIHSNFGNKKKGLKSTWRHQNHFKRQKTWNE